VSEALQGRDLPPRNVLGLMSGTSCDGVDAVLVRLERPRGKRLEWTLLARFSAPYGADLRARLLRTLVPETSDVATLTQLHTELGDVYASVCEALLAGSGETADLAALSGQTVFHIPRPDGGCGWHTVSTLQLGEAARVAERLRVPVLSDFRASDLAAGGQGAPLVAFGDLMLFHTPGVALSVHNLGGISNLTYLPESGDPSSVLAFDTGPGNCLLDEAATRFFGLPYDPGGSLAARGRVHPEVLDRLMAHPYLKLKPPKTTGREVFNLRTFEGAMGGLDGYDALATLSAFSAASMAAAYEAQVLPKGLSRVLVAGGGVHNRVLMAELRARLPVPVATLESSGLQASDREALAFAVMAYFAAFGLPNTLPQVTGARRAVVAGKLSCP
jgi:anhydro-N-acetylmuramic acid kinase